MTCVSMCRPGIVLWFPFSSIGKSPLCGDVIRGDAMCSSAEHDAANSYDTIHDDALGRLSVLLLLPFDAVNAKPTVEAAAFGPEPSSSDERASLDQVGLENVLG